MAATQFPTVPTPSAVATYSTINTRVYFDCNITPIAKQYLPWLGWTIPGTPEPDSNGNYAYYSMHEHEKYCLDRGFTPTLVVYNGTANQATMWSTNGTPDVLPFVTNRYQYNQANGNYGSDYMDAPDPVQAEADLHYSVQALTRLSQNADLYGGTAADYMPIIIDFESSKTFNGDGTALGSVLTPANHLLQTIRWREMLQTIRDIFGYSNQLFVYGHRQLALAKYFFGHDPAVMDTQTYADIIEQEEAVNALVSGWCSNNGYMSDAEIVNPFYWYQNIILNDREINDHYPQFRQSKIIFINPYYQPSSEANSYYGDLLPMQMWKDHIAFLVDRGWQLFIWIGVPIAGQTLAQVKPYIDWLAKYQK